MSLPQTSTLLNSVGVLERAGVSAGSIVADLGCGSNGHFVIPAGRMVGGQGKVYAVDILKSALSGVLSRARMEGVGSIETVWGNCEIPGGIKIADASVGIVLIVNNLFCAKDRLAFLSEAVRILKPNGKVILVDWKTSATPLGPPTASRIDAETARRESILVGLKVVDSWDPAPFFWGLILTK